MLDVFRLNSTCESFWRRTIYVRGETLHDQRTKPDKSKINPKISDQERSRQCAILKTARGLGEGLRAVTKRVSTDILLTVT